MSWNAVTTLEPFETDDYQFALVPSSAKGLRVESDSPLVAHLEVLTWGSEPQDPTGLTVQLQAEASPRLRGTYWRGSFYGGGFFLAYHSPILKLQNPSSFTEARGSLVLYDASTAQQVCYYPVVIPVNGGTTEVNLYDIAQNLGSPPFDEGSVLVDFTKGCEAGDTVSGSALGTIITIDGQGTIAQPPLCEDILWSDNLSGYYD